VLVQKEDMNIIFKLSTNPVEPMLLNPELISSILILNLCLQVTEHSGQVL